MEISIPSDFIQSVQNNAIPEPDNLIDCILENASPTTIRINIVKDEFQNSSNIDWCDNAYNLTNRPNFTLDPKWHAGHYYSQEANSMFIHEIYNQLYDDSDNHNVILDLCAAPGGKSTLIADLINDDDLLVSNEIIGSRCNILFENVIKWGKSNHIVTNHKPEDFANLDAFFDTILIDAPCSGEGLFRRDHNAMKEWSLENVENCSRRQKDIIQNIWNTLKEDGILIYSTCTFNRSENEETINWILQNYEAESVEINMSGFDNVVESIDENIFGYRFYPHLTQGEGFFVSVIRKRETTKDFQYKTKKKKPFEFCTKQEAQVANEKITNASKYELVSVNNTVTAIPKNHFNTISAIQQKLSRTFYPLKIGEVLKKKFIPNHFLAMSNEFNQSSFNKIELDIEQSLNFLARLPFTINNKDRSWTLMTFKNAKLGFINNLGNRFNNHYPKEWRIRMAINTTSINLEENTLSEFS